MSQKRAKRAISQVAPHVLRLTGGVANFYLVEEGGALTLVDAGTPGDWDLFQRALSTLSRRAENLDAVLLTHAHADHTGFAERARSELGAHVWVHEEDEAMARGEKPGKNDGAMGRYLARTEFYRTVISLTRRGGAKVVPVVEVSSFGHDQILDVPGKPRAIHAPGHTPGNAALFFEERGTLLSGDTLVTRNPLTGRTGPQIMPSGFNRDTGKALESLSTVEELRAEIVLPGHGEPWEGGIEKAVKLAREAGVS